MIRTIFICAVLSSAVCQAEPYWVSWCSGWPEEQGWTWGSSDPGPDRWLDGGSLFIDSRAALGLHGAYYQEQPGMFTPGPEETFAMQWRVNVHEVAGIFDPGVILWADDQYAVGFHMGVDRIYSDYEPALYAPFAAQEPHDFVLTSTEMRTYQLTVDNVVALQGSFVPSLLPGSYISWGDLTGIRSLSEWSSFAYGITPEPSACLLLSLSAWACVSVRRCAPKRSQASSMEELR
jgi:hypothetical protein